jgi:hypothetical protein
MLALYQNVGPILKSWWHTIEMLVLYQNVGTLLKCRRTIEMLASYENFGTWHFIEMLARY